jgi:hypothetical protein
LKELATLHNLETWLESIATFFTLEAKLQFGLNFGGVKCSFPNKLIRRYVRKNELISSMKENLGPKIRPSWKKKRMMPAVVGVHMLVRVYLRLSTMENVL